MVDEFMQQMQKVMPTPKRDERGNYVVEPEKFGMQAALDLLASPQRPRAFTLHEHIAQFGAFNLYRGSMTLDNGVQIEDADRLSLYLGSVPTPVTEPFPDENSPIERLGSAMRDIGDAMHLGSIAGHEITRQGVIAYVEQRQARMQQTLLELERFPDDEELSPHVRENIEVMRRVGEEQQRTRMARVAVALDELKAEGDDAD